MLVQFFTLLLLIFDSVESNSDSLYGTDDPITQLNGSNFDQTILNQNHYSIVQFYNRWCGHCVNFAQYWSQFARDVQGWKKVVEVAVVNCADLANTDLCRKYGIIGFPTIKVFGIKAKENFLLHEIAVEHDINYIRRELIKILLIHWRDNVTPSWPQLRPVNVPNLKELWKQVPSDTSTVLIIVDPPESYIGEEVILDLSGSVHPLLLKTASNETLGNELSKVADLSSLPVLLQINKRDGIKILARMENDDEDLRVKFVHTVDPSKIINIVTSHSLSPKYTTSIPASITNAIYMQDLENALNYSLRQEVGIHETVKGEKLKALKSYIKALKEYFPGRKEVMTYLNELFNWIMEQGDVVHVKNMIYQMKEMQTNEAYIPPRRDWKGCKGSTSGLRGYPCSLWILFHTLTVQALFKYKQGNVDRPQDVLLAVRGYVKYFFSCAECSEHFLQMASNLQNELQNPEDGILWLWKAHNNVNKRLASDILTNDPMHPKVQFPPETLCLDCRRRERTIKENISWKLSNVLTFLLHFYSSDQIVIERNEAISIRKRDVEIEALVNVANNFASVSKESSVPWKFRYFSSTDISLCVMLYVVSAMLLMIIYFLFSLRRQIFKSKYYPKHFNTYP